MPKRIRRRLFLSVIALSLTLSLSGCSLGTDVWTLLRTPHLTGEQEKVQTALDEYIKSTPKEEAAGGAGVYVLKYPKSGDYRSAFILKDLDRDGKEEAIAFYRRGPEGSNVHMNLLRQYESKWKSVSDIEGASADVEKVRFGDLDGDGVQEIMTGWNIDNVRDKQFVLYSISSGKFNVWDKTLYSAAVVGDLTACGHDNLLLVYANADKTTAQLWTLQRDSKTQEMVLTKNDSITIDGSIQQFGNCQIGKLSKTQNCAYVDGIRSSGGMVTEIIYWDGSQLRTPINTSDTWREALIPSCDVDGDGVIEWPMSRKLEGYTPESPADMLWSVDWNSLNYESQRMTQDKKFTCIMNLTDGYYLRLDKWKEPITAVYDSQTHELKMYTMENQKRAKELMVLRAVLRSEQNRTTSEIKDIESIVPDTRVFKLIEDLANVRYEVYISKEAPSNFTMEQVRYMFALFKNK